MSEYNKNQEKHPEKQLPEQAGSPLPEKIVNEEGLAMTSGGSSISFRSIAKGVSKTVTTMAQGTKQARIVQSALRYSSKH